MNAHDVSLLPMVAAIAMLPMATWAQTPTPKQRPGTETSPAQVKPSPQPTAPKPSTAVKTAPKTSTNETTPAKMTPTKQPTLRGQYDGWGAYWAAPDGRKVRFAAARPNGT